MLPLCRRPGGCYANSTGADESSFPLRSGNLAHDRRRVAQMVDQKRMADTRFDSFEGGFFDDGGVERAPAYVSAVGDEAVIGPENPSMRFSNRKNRIHLSAHRAHLFECFKVFARLAAIWIGPILVRRASQVKAVDCRVYFLGSSPICERVKRHLRTNRADRRHFHIQVTHN